MSRPPLPGQHLSDEAIAAFADGVLTRQAHDRANRHLDGCCECARAVSEQREAVFALRAAPAPALPIGLLDRLRAVPATTELPQLPMALDPSGAAVFPAYGTEPADAHPHGRRRPPFALFTAAAAFVAVGAGMAATSHVVAVPVAPAQVVPAGYSPADIHDGTTLHVQSALSTWSAR